MSKSLPFAIALFLFSIYLLSFSGKFHVMDELAVFTAGYNLAQHHRPDINQLIWTNHWTPNPPGIWGNDSNLYTKKPPGISFITAPLIGLGHTIPGLNAVHVGLLTNAMVTALTASLLFIWLTDLGFAQPAAMLTTLGYGLGTFAWVYARMFWESSLLALSFLAAIWMVYRATHLTQPQPQWPWLLLGGMAVAISLTLRFEAVLALILIGLYLAASQRRSEEVRKRGGEEAKRRRGEEKNGEVSHFSAQPPLGMPHAPRSTLYALRSTLHASRFILPLAIYLAPSLLIGLGLLYFNFIRYGSFGETGYTQEILFREPWVGAFGLLFSPGRGLFVYSPLLLLLFFGLRSTWRRLPQFYFWLIVAICLGYWLFYGSWFAWGGTWGWGPRFLLPILPLLMLFVAEPVEWANERRGEEAKRRRGEETKRRGDEETNGKSSRSTLHTPVRSLPLGRFTLHAPRSTFAWLGIGLLAALSLLINFLGVLVDFNEHFLRLGSNDNFVFNWAVFPPLAHWHILQEGLVDLIWLSPSSEGLKIEWSVLLPALALFVLATVNLVIAYQGQKEIRNEKLEKVPLAMSSISQNASRFRAKPPLGTFHVSRFILHPSSFILPVLAIALTYLMMRGTARVALTNKQAELDLPVLETLAASARPGDALLVAMPPFGDVQEISTRLMAYLERPLPTYTWIESEPRAIQPAERERVWQAVRRSSRQATPAGAQRVWLFERWLTQDDPTTITATRLNQEAFPVQEHWFEQSGKLTLYALAAAGPARPPILLNIPFQGGLTLVDFMVDGDTLAPGEVLKLRLTWQAAAEANLARQGMPLRSIIVFAQLLAETTDQKVAQNDHLLVNLQNFKQSPLLAGQTIQQGYGLQLPDNLAPGVYPLVIGLYQADNGQRLPRADGSSADFLYLTTIQVVASR